MLKKLMEFCEIHEIEFRMHFENVTSNAYIFTFICYDSDGLKYQYARTLTAVEMTELGFEFPIYVDWLLREVSDSFHLDSMENVIRRAKVQWYDNPANNTRTVYSRSKIAPLTEEEKIKLMETWHNESIHNGCINQHIVFK